MTEHRRKFIEENSDVFSILHLEKMAEAYLSRVKADVVISFIRDGQFNAWVYAINKGWSIGLSGYHLRTGVKTLRKISKQRITFKKEEKVLPPTLFIPSKKQARIIREKKQLDNLSFEQRVNRLNHQLDITYNKIYIIPPLEEREDA